MSTREDQRTAEEKRIHDLRNALRTLRLMSEALSGGYRFDDPLADQKRAAFERAVRVLEREFPALRM